MHCLSFIISEQKNDFSFLEKYEYWNEDCYVFKKVDVEKEIAQTKTIEVINKDLLNNFELNYLQTNLNKFYQDKKLIPACLLSAITVNSKEKSLVEISDYYKEKIDRYAIDILELIEKDSEFGEFYNPNGVHEGFSLGGRWDFFLPVKQDCLKQVIARKEKLKYKNNRFYANQLLLKEVDFDFLKENYYQDVIDKFILFKKLNIQLEPFEEFQQRHVGLKEEEMFHLYYVENKYVINLIQEVFGREKLHYAYSTTKISDIQKEIEKYEGFLSEDFVMIIQNVEGYLNIEDEFFKSNFESIINSPENQNKWISVLDLRC